MNRFCLTLALAAGAAIAAPASAATITSVDLRAPASGLLGGQAADFTVNGATLNTLPNGVGGYMADIMASMLGRQITLAGGGVAADSLIFTTDNAGMTSMSFGGTVTISGINGIPNLTNMTLRADDSNLLRVRLWTSTAQHYEIVLTPSFITATNENVAGVPEPETWALLIAGFGLAGAGFRFRARAKGIQRVLT